MRGSKTSFISSLSVHETDGQTDWRPDGLKHKVIFVHLNKIRIECVSDLAITKCGFITHVLFLTCAIFAISVNSLKALTHNVYKIFCL